MLVAKRVGDFYEFIGEDARIAARMFGLALTVRDGVAFAGSANAGPIIADCRNAHWPLRVAEANARLIAAAPETAAERDRLKVINAELVAACQAAYNRPMSRELAEQLYQAIKAARAPVRPWATSNHSPRETARQLFQLSPAVRSCLTCRPLGRAKSKS